MIDYRIRYHTIALEFSLLVEMKNAKTDTLLYRKFFISYLL